MKQSPILFSTDMVKAILEGRKTQTRRVVKPQPYFESYYLMELCGESLTIDYNQGDNNPVVKCPYGQTGDVLWVRETWRLTQPYGPEEYYFGYKVDCGIKIQASEKYDFHSPDVWKPSIHMPKEACRIFLRITNVRVERLQDITREDCIKEGIGYLETDGEKFYQLGGSWYDYERKTFNPLSSGKISPSMSFKSLWRSINGEQSWNDNPWVWVIEFERVE